MKIVIWTGDAWERWGAHSIMEGGIGGSETAAIHMATQLARLGHDVSIVGHVVPSETSGVSYIDSGECGPDLLLDIRCDVFISSRDRSAIRRLRPRTSLSVLWMHDLHTGEDLEEEMLDFDKIFVLSKYALKYALGCYPHVPAEKYVVTRNGIDPSLFLRAGESLDNLRPVKKSGCKVIYSSSYDRGLDLLLTFWPKIRGICPDVELNVYYGFDTVERQVALVGRKSDKLALDFFKSRLFSMSSQGVNYHGRVGQRQLAEAFLESSLWLYPTNFHETSCITAMEAQAAGTHTIVSNLAALPETLRMGVFVDPPNTRDGYEESFLMFVRLFIDNRQFVQPQLVEKRRWVLNNLSWQGVASDWDTLFSRWSIEGKKV